MMDCKDLEKVGAYLGYKCVNARCEMRGLMQ